MVHHKHFIWHSILTTFAAIGFQSLILYSVFSSNPQYTTYKTCLKTEYNVTTPDYFYYPACSHGKVAKWNTSHMYYNSTNQRFHRRQVPLCCYTYDIFTYDSFHDKYKQSNYIFNCTINHKIYPSYTRWHWVNLTDSAQSIIQMESYSIFLCYLFAWSFGYLIGWFLFMSWHFQDEYCNSIIYQMLTFDDKVTIALTCSVMIFILSIFHRYVVLPWIWCSSSSYSSF